MIEVMHIAAYPVKPELGGGYGFRIKHANGSEVVERGLPDYETARDAVIRRAHEMMGGANYRRASVKFRISGQRYRAYIYA